MDRIERAINKVLAPTLKAAGFELKKEWNCFVKFTDYGFDSFMVIDQGRLDVDQISIGCSIGIRHNRIQELFNTFGFIYGEEEQKQNVTFSLSYPFNARKNLDDYLKLNALTLQEDIAIADLIKPAFYQFTQILLVLTPWHLLQSPFEIGSSIFLILPFDETTTG